MVKNISLLIGFLFILAACAQPSTEVPTATVVPTFIPSATKEIISIYTPTTLSHEEQETTEFKIICNQEFPESDGQGIRGLDRYSLITLENFLSEDFLKQERAFIKNKPPFEESTVVPIEYLDIFTSPAGGSFPATPAGGSVEYSYKVSHLVIPSLDIYSTDPDTRPLKVLSLYPFLDFKLFEELGYKESKLKYTFNKSEELYQRYEPLAPSFWVMTWAYYNPDNSISLGHSFVSYSRQINHINHLKEDYPGKDGKLLLGYKIDDIVYCTDKDRNILITEYFLEKIYEMYPNIIPSEKLIKKWKETGQMPKELETVLFIAPSATILW